VTEPDVLTEAEALFLRAAEMPGALAQVDRFTQVPI
jgi:hypothetical protein